MRLLLLIALIFTGNSFSFAQFHVGVFAGVSNYFGDLNDKAFNRPKPALGLTGNYEISDRLTLRGNFTFAQIEGADQYSGDPDKIQNRNLSFQSNVLEFGLLGELTAFNLYNIRWSSYAFGGVAIFRFDPYTYDAGNKVLLQPLSTEGQGLAGYATKPYNRTDLAIPFGAGVKYNVNEKIRLAAEIGLRKTFTDYLDDVSTTYADPADLIAARGPQAAALAYRGSNPQPAKGALRGNSTKMDGYYFTGLHVTYRIGGSNGGARSKKLDCPNVPM